MVGNVRVELCVIAAGGSCVTLGVQGGGTMTEVPTIWDRSAELLLRLHAVQGDSIGDSVFAMISSRANIVSVLPVLLYAI